MDLQQYGVFFLKIGVAVIDSGGKLFFQPLQGFCVFRFAHIAQVFALSLGSEPFTAQRCAGIFMDLLHFCERA